MSLKAKQIRHDKGTHWVLEKDGAFYVMITGSSHSTSESAYLDLGTAIVRCDYLASRKANTNLKGNTL